MQEGIHTFGMAWLVAVDLYPEEVLEDIGQAYEEDLVDEGCIDLEWIGETLALGKERVLENLRGNRRHRFIGNAVSEMEWWACFDTPRQRYVVNRKRTVGRNEPCPCGSGKKYKRCCGSKR